MITVHSNMAHYAVHYCKTLKNKGRTTDRRTRNYTTGGTDTNTHTHTDKGLYRQTDRQRIDRQIENGIYRQIDKGQDRQIYRTDRQGPIQ